MFGYQYLYITYDCTCVCVVQVCCIEHGGTHERKKMLAVGAKVSDKNDYQFTCVKSLYFAVFLRYCEDTMYATCVSSLVKMQACLSYC